MANIGKSIAIKGDLTGNEDLVVEGKVEGKIALPDNELTVGNNGDVSADVHAKSVIVIGKVSGNVSATEKIEVQASGSVDGDVRAPRLIIQEGAVLNGSVEMTKGSGPGSTASAPSASPPISSIGKAGSSKG
jgi:cytoskeletal protein CcmA (bactofilin family)